MDYSGPTAADFANVQSLNHAFLSVLRQSVNGANLRRQLPADLQAVAEGLSDPQIQRLSRAPFLLMSFREDDDDLWHSLTATSPCYDLFAQQQAADETQHLITAGLGFLWQLAQRNPYAVRLISGASLDWCEQLADAIFLQLVQNTMRHRDLLAPRLGGQQQLWARLLGAGVSSETGTRSAAHLSVLQSLLTTEPASRYRRVRRAACAAATPALSIAEKQRR